MMSVTKEVPTKSRDGGGVLNFTTTLKSILKLLDLEAENDYGMLKPTEDAFKTAMQLLVDAYEIMESDFSKGSASTDDRGSIKITWKNRETKRLVRLFCPCNSGVVKNSWYGEILAGCRAKHSESPSVNLCHHLSPECFAPTGGSDRWEIPETINGF